MESFIKSKKTDLSNACIKMNTFYIDDILISGSTQHYINNKYIKTAQDSKHARIQRVGLQGAERMLLEGGYYDLL